MTDYAEARKRAEEALRSHDARVFVSAGEDRMAEALRALLAAEPEGGHEWGYWMGATWESCRVCGVVRRADNQNKPCRGPVAVTLRESSPAREYGPCPGYREGQSHAGCDLCGGLGALPVLRESDFAPSPARDEVREAAEEALGILTDLAESAAYWSEYDVPLGIVSRVDFAKARLAAALAEHRDAKGKEAGR